MAKDAKETTADPSAESDEALDALIQSAGGGDDIPAEDKAEKPARKRGEDGKFAAKEDEKDDDPGEDVKETQEYRDAIRALRRNSTPDDVIDGLDADQLIAWGAKLAKTQGDIDKKFDQTSKLHQELAELKKLVGQSAKDDGATPAGADTQGPDVDSMIEPVVKHFEQYGDDGAAEPFRKAFNSILKTIPKAEESNSELGDRLSGLEDGLKALMDRQAKAELVADYPQLDEPDKYERVLTRMKKLDGDDYPDHTAKMKDAAKMEFADEIIEAATKARRKTNRRREAGNPAANGKVAEAPKPSREDHSDRALDAAMAGDKAGYDENMKVFRR